MTLSPTHHTYPPAEVLSPLEQWVNDVIALEKVANVICKSPFVPDGMKDPGSLLAAILAGQELGFDPMTAAQSFSVIKGKAVLSARQMLALTLGAGHEVEIMSADETECAARGRRTGSESWTETVWTMERAKRMGLASKDNWRRMPQQMLEARAISEICRRIAPDALAGLTTSSEEMEDVEEAEVISRKPSQRPKPAQLEAKEVDFTDEKMKELAAPARKAKKGAAPIAKNPPPAPARETPAATADSAAPASEQARKMIVAAIEAMGLADGDAKLEELQRVTGDESLLSPHDMTAGHAQAAAEALGLVG